jgi:hypothetical protein
VCWTRSGTMHRCYYVLRFGSYIKIMQRMHLPSSVSLSCRLDIASLNVHERMVSPVGFPLKRAFIIFLGWCMPTSTSGTSFAFSSFWLHDMQRSQLPPSTSPSCMDFRSDELWGLMSLEAPVTAQSTLPQYIYGRGLRCFGSLYWDQATCRRA